MGDKSFKKWFDGWLENELTKSKEWGTPVIEELLTAIPEFRVSEYFDKGFSEDGIAYAVFSVGGFYSFVSEAMKRQDEALTRRCLDFLEELASRSDDRLDDLILVTFFENLGLDPNTRLRDTDVIRYAELHMGPHLRQLHKRNA